MTPGLDWIRNRLASLVRPATMERLVDPILSDVRLEWLVAQRNGAVWASRRILVAGVLALIKALAVHAFVNREFPVSDRRVLARAISYAATTTAAATLIFMAPVLSQLPDRTAAERFLFALNLTSQTFTVALPFGLLFGVLCGLRAARVSLRLGIAVLTVAAVCSAASLVSIQWAAPASNLAFRDVAMRNASIQRERNELTHGELRWRNNADRTGRPDPPLTYHTRWSVAAAPAVFAMWALLLLERGARKRWLIGLAVFATFAAWLALTTAGRFAVFRGVLPPVAGAWLPNLAFGLAALLLARGTWNRRTWNPEPNLNTNREP